MSNINHASETGKHILDAGAGISITLAWIEALTPVLNFVAVFLAIIWGVYRIKDMKLSNQLKQKKLDEHDTRSD